MRLASLYSGGKDSNLSLLKAIEFNHKVKCLINIKPPSAESFMFHFPNTDMVKLQAKALGMSLIQVSTKGEKEKEVLDLKNTIEHIREEIDGIIEIIRIMILNYLKNINLYHHYFQLDNYLQMQILLKLILQKQKL